MYVPKEESESEDETNRSESENSYDAHAYDRDDPPLPSSVNSLPRSIQRRCAQHAAGPHRMPPKTPQASILNRTAKPKTAYGTLTARGAKQRKNARMGSLRDVFPSLGCGSWTWATTSSGGTASPCYVVLYGRAPLKSRRCCWRS